MHELLETLRNPVVVTVVSIIVGVGVAVGAQSGRSRALWGSGAAVCLTGLSLGALAPEATLAPAGAVLGFSIAAVLRDRVGAKSTSGRDDEN